MNKKLISVIVSLGVVAGSAGMAYANTISTTNPKSLEASNNVLTETNKKVEDGQASVENTKATTESSNPFTKVCESVAKTFCKDQGQANKEEGQANTEKNNNINNSSQCNEANTACNGAKDQACENNNACANDKGTDCKNQDCEDNNACANSKEVKNNEISIFGFKIPCFNNGTLNKGNSCSGTGNSDKNGSVEAPAEKPANDKPAENPIVNNPTDKPVNKPVEKPVEKPADKPAEKPVDKPENKPADKPAEKPAEQPSNDSAYVAQIEQMIFNKVNEERAKAGVAPLSYNNTMQKYARIKSEDMGVKKYFSHEDPNGQLITAKMKADGVSYNAWGENIAYLSGYSGDANIANQFMTNWMNSSGHRANILSPDFTSIGIGVYKVGNTYYATQEFMK